MPCDLWTIIVYVWLPCSRESYTHVNYSIGVIRIKKKDFHFIFYFLTNFSYFSVLSVMNKNDARIFIILSLTGITALLPLLYPTDLLPLKILLFIFYAVFISVLLIQRFNENLLFAYEWMYIASFPVLILYESMLHQFLFGEKLPFLPLAVTSVYCSLGITYSFCVYYFKYLQY